MNGQNQAPKSLFQRFARLKSIQEEKRRQTAVVAPVRSQGDEYNVAWRNSEEATMWNDHQLEYTRQYVAEYKGESEPQRQKELSTLEEDEILSTTDDGCRTETSEQAGDDRVGKLISLRDKRKAARVLPSVASESTSSIEPRPNAAPSLAPSRRGPASTCIDFEQTSTILQPTEMIPTEYRSNVNIEDLKSTYFANYRSNKTLPIYQERDKIVRSINAYDVVIIEGLTGCGKTTQVPMYILEDAIINQDGGRSPVIYVTQPRRIAARSIAERICSEHQWNLGSLVGYQVGLDKNVGPQTVLVFCTAGVLLQKIIQEKSLANYTHIIIDEAHERDADTDLLMMMVRKLMLTEISNFRLVIMSATMDIEKLKEYYSFKTQHGNGRMIRPAHIQASQQRLPTNLQVFYMDKLIQNFKLDDRTSAESFDELTPDLKDECLEMAVEIITDVILRMDNFSEQSKSTLVFLPGLAEISRLDRMLRSHVSADFLDIIPLHSCLTVADQLKIFLPTKKGARKVILATNIAESSITLTDVGFVVDFCLTKTLVKDNVTRIPTLRMSWATKDKCIQRAGRTGRCCPGKVFRMVPHSFFQRFGDYAEPELLTAPLELSALRVKMFGMGDILALLAVVLDPPPRSEIRTAVLELKQIGALSATHKGRLSDIDGDLTELGRILSALPIDVHLSKLIVLGSVFNVLENTIIIAACLSTNRTVIKFHYGGGELYLKNYETRLDWAKGTQSDLFVSLDCYKEFRELRKDRGKSDKWLARWCDRNFLDERKLLDVDAMVTELEERLRGVNIIADNPQPNREPDPSMDYLMLKVAFAAAFYPNYFLTDEDRMDPDTIHKKLGTLDPNRSIIISGFPLNQVPLYKPQIVDQLKLRGIEDFDYIADCSRAIIVLRGTDRTEDEDSSKLAEVIDQSKYKVLEQTTEIPKQMYLALKSCDPHGFNRITIREFHEEEASGRMLYYQAKREHLKDRLRPRLIPSLMKIVGGQDDEERLASNQRLLTCADERYVEVTRKDYFYEVDLDAEQAGADQEALRELEEQERSDGKRGEYLCHPIYKPGYVQLEGPHTPIKAEFRSVLVKSMSYKVEIDHQSVNSILLDPDFEKRRRQMLVAASMSKTNKGTVMVRDTTLMPNIRGLPSLFALLFAQYYRLIYNERMQCIAGAIFGIGWDAEDMPLDRTYEVILGFDVQISPEDLDLINKARHRISELLKFTEIVNVGKPLAEHQDALRQIILALLRRRRYPLKALDVSMIYYPSESEEDDDLFRKDIHNLPSDMIAEGRSRPFLPRAEFTRPYPDMSLFSKVRDNLENLRRIDEGESIPRGGIRCLVCGNGFKHCYTMTSPLIMHLRSGQHLEKVREFEEFEKCF